MATKESTTATANTTAGAGKTREYIMDGKVFDDQTGQEFGGQSDVLEIKANECAGPFEYCGHTQITTELGEATSHTAFDEDGNSVRLPIQATFLKAIDQARIQVGDTFAIKRYDDVLKKKGKGAGKPMAIYSVKVMSRAAVAQGQDTK